MAGRRGQTRAGWQGRRAGKAGGLVSQNAGIPVMGQDTKKKTGGRGLLLTLETYAA